MAACRTIFVILERDAAFNQTAPRNVSRLLFHHHPDHIQNPNPVSINYDMLSVSVRFLAGGWEGLKNKTNMRPDSKFSEWSAYRNSEQRNSFNLCARDIIHNVPPSNSMVLIPSWSVQRSLVEVASKWPPPPHLHWWQLTSHFHNNQYAYWLVGCGYFP